MRKKVLVFSHKGCLDGFYSVVALAAHYGANNVEAIYCSHGDEFNPTDYDLVGRTAYILDFSFTLDIMSYMASKVESLTIIDHHISSEDRIEEIGTLDNVEAVFDLDASGALLTWQYFFPDEMAPMVIRHVSDRDLWKFQMEYTKPICAALYEHKFELNWGLASLESCEYSILKAEGELLVKIRDNQCSMLASTARIVEFAGYNVLAVNAPYFLTSDTCNLILTQNPDIPFVFSYFIGSKGMGISMRGHDKVDLSKIAASLGGGGHKNAAGCGFQLGSEEADMIIGATG
jgi:oligoribonuclease NrnB/cAMP/cGMP phosphodiesterase (DHH superfamily)